MAGDGKNERASKHKSRFMFRHSAPVRNPQARFVCPDSETLLAAAFFYKVAAARTLLAASTKPSDKFLRERKCFYYPDCSPMSRDSEAKKVPTRSRGPAESQGGGVRQNLRDGGFRKPVP
jgi:hypothetical protein